jgi:threonine dehydrogenase-like Zn-dependent dehydrogenase
MLDCVVDLVDVNPARAAIARGLGVRFFAPDAVPEGADVVIHASGSAEGLAVALKIAALEAIVVELSWYGDRAVPVALGEGFHARRLTLKSSQVGSVAASQRSRWDTRRRVQFAMTLLANAELDGLITGESAFDALPEVMSRLSTTPGDTLCHRIKYS